MGGRSTRRRINPGGSDETPAVSKWDGLEDWKTALQNQHSLFVQLFKEREELAQRVSDLEARLAAATSDHSEYSDSHFLQSGKLVVVCLIDGNEAVFHKDYLIDGKEGGLDAADQLAEDISRRLIIVSGPNSLGAQEGYQVHATLFMDVKGVARALASNGVCSQGRFEQFVVGFNEADPFISIVDIGEDKSVGRMKLTENILFHCRNPQASHVVVGGIHDFCYLQTLRFLRTEGSLENVHILKGSRPVTYQLNKFIDEAGLELIELPSLFFGWTLSPGVDRATAEEWPPLSLAALLASVMDVLGDDGGQPSQSSQRGEHQSSNDRTHGDLLPERPGKHINPSLPLTKQNPPLCNFHYLRGPGQCPKKDKCRFSHDYTLSDSELKEFRESVKELPCPRVKRGGACPDGENCLMAHPSPKKHVARIG